MLKVVTIEFEQKDAGERKASILCTSNDDAINFLKKITNNGVNRVSNFGMDVEVHGFSDAALEYIDKKRGITDQQKEAEPVGNDVNKYVCPWCEKSFAKAATLKAHITKTHSKKE